MKEKVSVLVPAYNYGKYLPECIDSILGQDYTNIEVLIVDDVSQDNTEDIAREYERKDSRVKYIRNEKNIGHIKNYNQGLAQCRGEFVYPISADDKMLPGNVRKKIDLFNADPDTGLVFSSVFVEKNGKYIAVCGEAKESFFKTREEAFLHILLKDCVLYSPSVLVRKRCLEDVGVYDERFPHSGDFDLWLRIAEKYKVNYVPEPLCVYRVHDENMHKARAKMKDLENNILPIITRYSADPLLSSAMRRRVFFRNYFVMGKSYAGVFHWKRALLCFLKAFLIYPEAIFIPKEWFFMISLLAESLRKQYLKRPFKSIDKGA